MIFWQVPGTKHKIPNDEVISIVVIGFCFQHGMMPTMQFGSTHEVIQDAKTHINVTVLEKSIDGIAYNIETQHLFLYS